MDYDNLFVSYNEAKNQLEKSIAEIDTLNDKYDDLLTQNRAWINKVNNAEKDAQQVRNIMTQNIVDSNAKNQSYLGEIQELRGIIKQLKSENK